MLNTGQFTITDICMGTNKMLLRCLLHSIPKRLCIKQDRSYFMLERTVFQRGTKLCPGLSVIEENIVSTFPLPSLPFPPSFFPPSPSPPPSLPLPPLPPSLSSFLLSCPLSTFLFQSLLFPSFFFPSLPSYPIPPIASMNPQATGSELVIREKTDTLTPVRKHSRVSGVSRTKWTPGGDLMEETAYGP